MLQLYSSKLLQGVSEGGPLRLIRSASFFAGLCGMPASVTTYAHTNPAPSESLQDIHNYSLETERAKIVITDLSAYTLKFSF